MKPNERAQFALTLGWDAPQSEPAFSMVDPSVEYPDLIRLVDADPERAVERFAYFLQTNPRSIRTLDADTIRAILLPVIGARQAEVQGTDDPSIPYTDELLSVLHHSIPRVSTSGLRAGVGRSFAPVVRLGNVIGALPARAASALSRFAGALGRIVASPFVAIYRGARALFAFVATLPGRISTSAIGNGARASVRSLTRIPSIIAAVLTVAAAAIARPFVAFGHAGIALARVPATIAASFAAGTTAIAGRLASTLREIRHLVVLSQRAAAASARSGAARGGTIARGVLPALRRSQTLLPAAVPAVVAITAAGLFFILWSALTPLIRNAAAPTLAESQPVPAAAASRPEHRSNSAAVKRTHTAPRRVARVKLTKKPALRSETKPPVHVASVRRPVRPQSWKFDPNRNPYMSSKAVAALATRVRAVPRVPEPAPARSTTVAAASADASHEPQLVQRARLVVSSYLDSIQRGDASSALGNLGLSANASAGNLTESQILTRTGNFRIVGSALREGGTSAKVDVEILTERGRFFGVFTVVADGPAVRITEHTVIPGDSVAAHR